jgi:hypothetical protein
MIAPILHLSPEPKRTMLEVGCGFGFALDFARQLGDDIVMRPSRHPMLLAGDQNYSNSMPVRGGRNYDQSTASATVPVVWTASGEE